MKVGPTRFELVTSSLSGTRSNQLSYEPAAGHSRHIFHSKRHGHGVNLPVSVALALLPSPHFFRGGVLSNSGLLI